MAAAAARRGESGGAFVAIGHDAIRAVGVSAVADAARRQIFIVVSIVTQKTWTVGSEIEVVDLASETSTMAFDTMFGESRRHS